MSGRGALTSTAERALVAAGLAYLVLDGSGRVTEAASDAATLLGLTDDALVGRRLEELVPSGDRAWVERFCTQLVSGGPVPAPRVLEIPDHDGGLRAVELSGHPGGDDGALLMIANLRSADQQERRVSKRRRMLERFNRLFLELASHRAMTSGDPKRIFGAITEATADLIGIDRVSVWLYDEARTRIHCWDLYERGASDHFEGIELAARDFPEYFAALEEDRTIAADEARTDPRTSEFGEVYLKPLGISSMLDAPIRLDGRAVGVVCNEHVGDPRAWTAEDEVVAGAMADLVSMALQASERRAALESLARSEAELREHRDQLEELVARRTEELRRSNAELQQFAYVASHDLQEPLRTIAGFTQLLAKRYRDQLGEEGMEFIDFAVEGAHRMQALIQDLLSYSRVETQAGGLTEVALDEVVDEALENLRAAIQESGATVQRAPLPVVRGDRSQLVQLFQNLVGNAIKFHGQRPPRVELGVERAGDRWRLSVRDHGIGIEAKYADRIFEIFQRLHSRAEYEGTGIGLAVCKRIVTRHGGEIGLESTPGEGTTFFITLPSLEETSHEESPS